MPSPRRHTLGITRCAGAWAPACALRSRMLREHVSRAVWRMWLCEGRETHGETALHKSDLGGTTMTLPMKGPKLCKRVSESPFTM